MNTVLKNIVIGFQFGLGFVCAIPFAITASIISDIKHESLESYYRRAFRMLPSFLKGNFTEDDVVDIIQNKML